MTARRFHPGGVNGLLRDDSVRFHGNGTAQAMCQAHGTRVGGEVVEE